VVRSYEHGNEPSVSIKFKVLKVKFTLYPAMQAQSGSRGKTLPSASALVESGWSTPLTYCFTHGNNQTLFV
jgi:hypothetical protein